MSTILYGAEGEALLDSSGKKYPDLPLGTYFANAGLSHREAFEASGACLKRAKELLVVHLRNLEIEHPGRAKQYLSDHNKRVELNKQVIAAALLEMGFNSREIREIDKGLGLQLLMREKLQPMARVSGPNGTTEYAVNELDPKRENGKTILLTDMRTGQRSAH